MIVHTAVPVFSLLTLAFIHLAKFLYGKVGTTVQPLERVTKAADTSLRLDGPEEL